MERGGTPYGRRRKRGRIPDDTMQRTCRGGCDMEIEIVESSADSLGTEVTHVP
jgi:hypothetical protein